MMRRSTARRTALALAAVCACGLGPPGQAAPVADAGARNLVLQSGRAPAQTVQRLALVVGNSAYTGAPLENPANDARAMARTLEAAGFTVMLQIDVDHRQLLAALRDFGSRLRQGGVGLFYFAGHGMQIKGRNYLIPIGADIQREDEVAYAALDAQAVLDKMEAAGNGANLMILDACRNNPFARSFRSSGQGLAQMEAPVGTMVAFATAPGAVASDGHSANGLYTQHLLTAMRKPGSKVEDVFKQVRAAVRRDSQGKQVPWETTSLEGDLYFIDPPAAVAPPLPAPPPPAPDPAKTLDAALWDAVRNSSEPVELRAYLKRFPEGRFAVQAHLQLARLEEALRPTAPVPPAAVVAAPEPTPTPAAATTPTATPAAVATAPTATAAATTSAVEALNSLPSRPYAAMEESLSGSLWTVDAVTAARQRETAAATPPAPQLVRPAAGSGPSAGDRWNYRRIDLWRGEVTSQSPLTVARVDSSGALVFKELNLASDPLTQLWSLMLQPSAFGVTVGAQHPVWWAGLMPGSGREVTLDTTIRRSDGSFVPAALSATITLRGTEKVKVPAGDFDALRLDLKGHFDWAAPITKSTVRRPWSMTLWYVSSLHGFAAYEIETRVLGGGGLESRWRNELTTYAFVDRSAEVAAPDLGSAGADGAGAAAPALAPVPAPSAPTANPRSYAVGDTWTFQRIDRWNNQVIDDPVELVVRAGDDGSPVLSGDAAPREPWYHLLRGMMDPAAPGARPVRSTRAWWEDMKTGEVRDLVFRSDKRLPAGGLARSESKVSVRRGVLEPVQVPAGRFDAIRFDCDGSSDWTVARRAQGDNGFARWTMTLWFVPRLQVYVAADVNVKSSLDNRQNAERERIQLSTYTLAPTALSSR